MTQRGIKTRTGAIGMAATIVALTAASLFMQALGSKPDVAETLLPIAFAAMGGIVAVRASANPLGWLFLAVGLLMSGGQAGDSLMFLARDRWDAMTVAKVTTILTGWVWLPTLALMATFCLLLFPDGRLPSRRWRPVAWIAAVGIGLGSAVMFAFPLFSDLDALILDPHGDPPTPAIVDVLMVVAAAAVFIGIVGSIVSLIVRWRRATGTAKQQLKWFALGGALQVVGIAAGFVTHNVATFVSEISTLALPAAATVAITRYRLYEIDRIVSRTVGWALLTLVLGGVYLGGVTLLTSVTATAAGGSPFTVAAATLATAAAFGPARRRIQAGVDRRFNRARYDAAKTAAAYRARLRDQLDLESIADDLVTTARVTVHPKTAMVWLIPPGGRA